MTDWRNCGYIHFDPTFLTIFLSLSLLFGVVGLTLICKSDSKIPDGHYNLFAYGGMALTLITPFIVCVWMVHRIVSCYGWSAFSLW